MSNIIDSIYSFFKLITPTSSSTSSKSSSSSSSVASSSVATLSGTAILEDALDKITSHLKSNPNTVSDKPIFNKIKDLYGPTTYMGRYEGDLMKSALIIFLFIVAITYYYVQNNIQQVKQNWPEYRCMPNVMPFAGWINAPQGVDAIEYTKTNFIECSKQYIQGAYEGRIGWVYNIINIIAVIFKKALLVIENLRLLLNRVRNALKSIFTTLILRMHNFIIPFQNLLIKMIDFFEKIKGILVTFIMTFIGVLWSFYSLIGSIYELVIIILVIMIVVIIVLWYIPFVGWALALAAIIVFLTIAIPLIALGIVSRQITRRRTSGIPSPD
jgi:hypothetical protein